MVRKKKTPRIAEVGDDRGVRDGAGNRRTISMSKTKKITASRKNRRENGSRAEEVGSNPHSKGDIFSRSCVERWARDQETRKTKMEIVVAIVKARSVSCIV